MFARLYWFIDFHTISRLLNIDKLLIIKFTVFLKLIKLKLSVTNSAKPEIFGS